MAAVVDHGGSLGRARALFPQAPAALDRPFDRDQPALLPAFRSARHRLDAVAGAAACPRTRGSCGEGLWRGVGGSCRGGSPGTQILLPRVSSLVRPGRALILGPTYAEHRRAAAIAGHEAAETGDFEALADADLAIVVNPNNPDGRLIARNKLLGLAETLRAQGRAAGRRRGLHGCRPARTVRLRRCRARAALSCSAPSASSSGWPACGLALPSASQDIVGRLDAEFGPWAVAGPALEYGIRALGDTGWQSGMRQRLQEEAARLDGLLARFGIEVDGGTSLFRHITMPDAAALFETLGNRASSCATSPTVRPNFASDCRAARRNGGGLKMRWRDGRKGKTVRNKPEYRDDLCLPAVESRRHCCVVRSRSADFAARRRHGHDAPRGDFGTEPSLAFDARHCRSAGGHDPARRNPCPKACSISRGTGAVPGRW